MKPWLLPTINTVLAIIIVFVIFSINNNINNISNQIIANISDVSDNSNNKNSDDKNSNSKDKNNSKSTTEKSEDTTEKLTTEKLNSTEDDTNVTNDDESTDLSQNADKDDASQNSYVKKVESEYSFSETEQRIRDFLNENNIKIFSEFNHSDEAVDVSLELNPLKVIVFGNPAVVTLLIQDNPTIALELPLKIMISENAEKTYLYYEDPEYLAEKYNLSTESKGILANIKGLFERIETIINQ